VEEETIDALVPIKEITSGRYTSRDYDYTRPRSDLTVTQADPRETRHNDYEIYAWHAATSGSAHYVQPEAGPGQAANEPIVEGEQLARLRMQALKSPGWRAKGGGKLRGLVPGYTFRLIGHPHDGANIEYLTLETELLIEEIARETQKSESSGTSPKTSSAAEQKGGLREQQWRVQVDFELHPTQSVYRPAPTRVKPLVPGPEVALVTGPEGQNLWTDGLGRIKVQFYWDRYGTKNENSSCWVRVTSPWAGNQLGGIDLPRIGQEVIISYLNGDPDLPLCTGRVFNQANLPPWRLPEQQALSGLRSRELVEGGGNVAAGRSNHLVLDDTNEEIQVQLKSDHQSSQLSLGHITRIEDHEGRKDYRGEGFELRTDGHGVIRAAEGLLVTTESRPEAKAHIKDMRETLGRLQGGQSQHDTLGKLAQKHEAHSEQNEVADALKTQNQKIQGKEGAEEEFPELEEPHLVFSSPAGIASTTPKDTHLHSGGDLAFTSGRHSSFSVGKRFLISAKEGLKAFAYQGGMKLVSAIFDIDIQSLRTNIHLLSKLKITQTANEIILTAEKEITLNGGTSYTRWSSRGIEHGTRGAWVVHAGTHDYAGPESEPVTMPPFPEGEPFDNMFVLRDETTGEIMPGHPYRIKREDGSYEYGVSDKKGRTHLITTINPEQLTVEVPGDN
jgi:type VI secretion system secreted protein VgrG